MFKTSAFLFLLFCLMPSQVQAGPIFARYDFVGEYNGQPFNASVTNFDFRIVQPNELLVRGLREFSSFGLFPGSFPPGLVDDLRETDRIIQRSPGGPRFPFIYNEALRQEDPNNDREVYTRVIRIAADLTLAQAGLPLEQSLFIPGVFVYEEFFRTFINEVHSTPFEVSFPLTLAGLTRFELNVPEPGSLGFVALGAVALFARRKLRRSGRRVCGGRS